MTDKLRAAAQMALAALENDVMQRTFAGGIRITNAAIALRAALDEVPVGEAQDSTFGDFTANGGEM